MENPFFINLQMRRFVVIVKKKGFDTCDEEDSSSSNSVPKKIG